MIDMAFDDVALDEMNYAQRLYGRGNLDEALTILLRSVGPPESDGLPSPKQGPVLELLGRVYHDLGRPFEAADAIEKASLVVPVSDETRIALASSYAQLRRIDLARELYLQLAIRRQLSADLMLQVAAGLEAIDSPQLAMQVCEWITERDDDVAQAYYDMGIYSARSGNALYLTEALTHRALQLDPGNLHYRIGLVSLMIQLDRDDEAIKALGAFAAGDVDKVTCESCLSRVAAMLERRGKNDLARQCKDHADQLRQRKAGNVQRARVFAADVCQREVQP